MEYSTIEQALEKKEHIFLQTSGVSMEPLLHHRKSTVMIKKLSEAPEKYDVVLYKRPAGEYVLHRIVKVREEDYLICGDNGIYKEPVPRKCILGIMAGFYPDEGETFISCEDEAYKEYVRTWDRRYIARRTKAWLGRVRRKLRR